MKRGSKILVDIKFIGQKVIEIEVSDIGFNIDDIIKKKTRTYFKYYLKIKENSLYDSNRIKLKRMILLDDSLVENIKAVMFKPLRNIHHNDVYFKRTLLDNSNYPIYKKALIELGLDLRKIDWIDNDGILSIEKNGFRHLVEYNLIKRGH